MAVSKRLRYEILRRDNHACRYCGAAAPDVKLTVDHVTPIALGGTDDPTNLVTACVHCNAGKTSSSPDAPLVANIAEDALRWAKAVEVAARAAASDTAERARLNREFYDLWLEHCCGYGKKLWHLDSNWSSTLDGFRARGLPQDVILEAFWIAYEADHVHKDSRWRYMCGICRKRLAAIEDAARVIFTAEDGKD